MKKTCRNTFSSILLIAYPLLCLVSQAHAAETFEYPELMVTPRASDRLELEAQKEQASRWKTHLTLQAPALMTFFAGVMQDASPSKDPDSRSSLAGIAVGGGWLAVTAVMSFMEGPYSAAHREVGPMPKKTTREQLTRERYAEEAIRSQGRLAKTLRWLSVATNLGASIYMVANVKKDTFSSVLDGVSVAVAFTPLIFPHPWREVARSQEDYKKRIYAPVADAALLREPGTSRLAPGLQLSLHF